MEANLLLEQYSRYKKSYLEESPYKCLLNTDMEHNPHQINAFCAAISALKTGGIILADEVGLGKTIEAGLVLKYVLDSGAKKILIVLPAALRKQWEVELDEKFSLRTKILDRSAVQKDFPAVKRWIESGRKCIVILSYDYASKFMKRFPDVKWDFIIIDEAHNLRNVFRGTKRAKKLYDISKGIPKILLTATPLQNSLEDLHGLVSFIDPRIFGEGKVFERRYIDGQNYDDLKEALRPVLYRTLRKDVVKYMDFKKRECITVDFQLTPEEKRLYELVNAFLQRKVLYSIPAANKGLIVLVIRKLLASSSFALIETFAVMKNRLEKLYEGTKSGDAQEGFDIFWQFIEDEMDEEEPEETADENTLLQKQEILEEIDIVKEIIDVAKVIETNAKISALKTALERAFSRQEDMGIPQKAVVFTESKRTQEYIEEELLRSGYDNSDILLFNGNLNNPAANKIYNAWRARNYGKANYSRSVLYKHAIVDYFKNNAKILIVTDAGSEGLNLQFCNTVINYDLPWNPQKIEQRIGRCHRYGQKNDVVAVNLLNTENEADKRVYEILRRKFELFDGVFGASDIALGTLESGVSFEKKILDIYQKCTSDSEFEREFNKLDNKIESDIKSNMNEKAGKLRSLLLAERPESKGEALERTKTDIDKYLDEVQYWGNFAEPEMDGNLYYWEIRNWGQENIGGHGTLFIGAFCNNAKILFPVLLLCDESGEYINFEEKDIVRILEKADDEDVHNFKPSEEELKRFREIHNRLTGEMLERYSATVEPLKQYNRQKLKNWVRIKKEQLDLEITELKSEVEEAVKNFTETRDSDEKDAILKKIAKRKQELEKREKNYARTVSGLEVSAEKDIKDFDEQFQIHPILVVNIVLKF